MNLSQPFVRRPVATVLLTIGLALAGVAAFFNLPVAPLPQVDFPVISVSANLPGASPDTMATSVATPLERRLATIAGVNEVTSNTKTPGQIYDAVSNIVQQKVSQVPGVGDVELGGGSLPAVRVEMVPFA